MLDLSYALPRASIDEKVPHALTSTVATNVLEWKAAKPEQVATLALFVWDEMVDRGMVKMPFKIAPYANDHSHKKGIYNFVQKELGRAPVSLAYTVELLRVGEETSFVDLSLVRCFPNDIHICDVEFSDKSQPIDVSDPTFRYRSYRGLHVFPEFIDRLTEVARSQGARRISLMAAHPPLKETFERYGFEASQTEMAKRGVQAGHGFPMILRV